MICKEDDCEGTVEANAKIWFTLHDDGSWSVYGVADEQATFGCDAEEHDNHTPALAKSLEAYIESILPNTTWTGSNPRLRDL